MPKLIFSIHPKQKNHPEGVPSIKQVLPAETQKEYGHLFVLLFTRLALQGIVCYTF